eukprot:scaffold70086_cov41-Tisochrysis_lutea.AAC.1
MMDSDATYDLSFHQPRGRFHPARHTTRRSTPHAAIVELLLELEGVDPEPDFCARSSKGGPVAHCSQ